MVAGRVGKVKQMTGKGCFLFQDEGNLNSHLFI